MFDVESPERLKPQDLEGLKKMLTQHIELLKYSRRDSELYHAARRGPPGPNEYVPLKLDVIDESIELCEKLRGKVIAVYHDGGF